ncbi:MAG: hypothetical protein PHI91_01585 [Candidatus Pacebacteria bacterium]|nr:hypothetical protein [Candidatus Paceibacterota bacterium]MDD2757550.1 hypothetical protein [Candidatus Paceibacterota bacterium]MDD3283737.1 hypothetical protein [Candidatus Paceibacterota bacterium]MDD3969873.1 hypothetical protein [Candidatus Paceibacterota bacterium]MDD4737999.1 hypothetical protein [Candidatus Paceibacterota bacterium]
MKDKQKGYALYLMITMMAVLLAVVLGLSTIIIGGVNLAILSGDSFKAFYAADSGIEESLYRIYIDKIDSEITFSGGFSFSPSEYGATYDVTISYNGESPQEITSTGKYNEARKKIEASFNE